MSAEQEIQEAFERNDWDKVMFHARDSDLNTDIESLITGGTLFFTFLGSAVNYNESQKRALIAANIPVWIGESSHVYYKGKYYIMDHMACFNLMGVEGRKRLATTLANMGLNLGNNWMYMNPGNTYTAPKDTTVNELLPFTNGSVDPIALSIARHKFDLMDAQNKNVYAPWNAEYEALYKMHGGFPGVPNLREWLTAICKDAGTTLPAWLDKDLTERALGSFKPVSPTPTPVVVEYNVAVPENPKPPVIVQPAKKKNWFQRFLARFLGED
jgi:hypothetical protein